MPGIVIVFVTIAIVLGIGATIVDNIQDTQTENSSAYNASGSGLEALTEFAGWQPILAIVVVAAVVIGVISFFWQRGQ